MSPADKDSEANFYLTIFGWMQIFCLLVAPAIGQVLDRNLANAVDDPQLGDKPLTEDTIFRRVQSLQNTRNAYLITQVNCLYKDFTYSLGLSDCLWYHADHSGSPLLPVHYIHTGHCDAYLFTLNSWRTLCQRLSFCSFGKAHWPGLCLWCYLLSSKRSNFQNHQPPF